MLTWPQIATRSSGVTHDQRGGRRTGHLGQDAWWSCSPAAATLMRFTDAADPHRDAGRRSLRQAAFAPHRRRATRRCSPIPRSTRWCWRRRRPAICKQIEAAAAAGKHVYCEKPFTLLQEGGRGRGRRRAQGQARGRRRLQPPLPSGDDQAARPHPARASSAPSSTSKPRMTYPNALFLPPTAWRAQQGGGAARRAHADGRARHRRHDRSRAARSTTSICQSFRARGADRHRRHHLDAVSHEGRHVGLSRHHDHDRRGLQLPGVRLQGLACGSRA